MRRGVLWKCDLAMSTGVGFADSEPKRFICEPLVELFSSEQSRGHKSSGLVKLFRLLVRVPVLKKNVGCSGVLVLRSDWNISLD